MNNNNKRQREEHSGPSEDEIVKRIATEVMKAIEQQKQPFQQSSNEVKKQEKTIPTDVIIETFNEVLCNVLHEDGLKFVSSTDGLFQFNGIIPYPFEMNMELMNKIAIAGKGLSGDAWGIYDVAEEGQLVKLFFTQDKALRVAKSGQDQKDDFERTQKFEKYRHQQGKTLNRFDMMSYSLVSHLAVDVKTHAALSQRPIGDGMTVISATVVLAEPLRSHQLEKIAAFQGPTLKALTWGKHQTLNKLRLTLEVTSPSMIDLSAQETINGGAE